MATSIDENRRHVQEAFDAAYRLADESEPGPLAVFEPALWTAVLGIGRALMALWIARCFARPRLTWALFLISLTKLNVSSSRSAGPDPAFVPSAAGLA